MRTVPLLRKAVPLERAWTFHVHYAEGTYVHKPLQTIRTVQDFWNTVNNVPSVFYMGQVRVNKLHVTGLSLFREGVTPEWEHDENREGSIVRHRCSMTRERINAAWIDACLYLIGEQLHINGIRITSRPAKGSKVITRSDTMKSFKLEFWLGRDDNVTDVFDFAVDHCDAPRDSLQVQRHSSSDAS